MNVIRVSETWQRAAVYYLRIQAFVKGQRIPIESEFDQYDGEQTRYVLILEDKEPVATARLQVTDEQTAKIGRVCVAEPYRGQGVGRQLIEAAENWARELGIQKVIITSQVQAVGFYESLDYKVNPDIVFQSKIPIVYTEKLL